MPLAVAGGVDVRNDVLDPQQQREFFLGRGAVKMRQKNLTFTKNVVYGMQKWLNRSCCCSGW